MRPSAMRAARVGAGGEGGVVGDQDQGRTGPRHQLEHQIGHRGGVGGVEIAGGLVGEQQLGTGREGAGQGDALLLSAGHLVRIVPRARFQTDPVQPGRGLVGGVAIAGDLQRGGDVLGRRHVRQQVEGLEHQRHPPTPQQRPAVLAEGSQVLAEQSHRPAGRPFQPGGHGDERRLSATRGSDHRDPFPSAHLEIDTAQDVHRTRRRRQGEPHVGQAKGRGGRAAIEHEQSTS